MISIGALTQSALTPLFKAHKHFHLMVDWPSIVGQDLAAYTWPQKLTISRHFAGVLHLQVAHSQEMAAWGSSPLIIERVNQYLGYQAVKRIRLFPLPFTPQDHRPPSF